MRLPGPRVNTEQLLPPSPRMLDDVLAGTPYRAVRPLGRGGMGEVFEAEHVALGKRVVVKLLRPELSHDGSLVERLRIEAQAMAKLHHPHIAAVHDLGTTPGGRPYFVLEYLAGRTLAEELTARGSLPVHEAVRIALEVLDGLGAAHAAGLVHRDIKPPNVFLCDPDRNGRRVVKILDFGIVKVSPSRVPRAFPTEGGQFIGSPASAAPEQARGETIDARADLYATGLLLYTLIAGKTPFSGAAGSAQAVLWAHVLTVPAKLSSAARQAVPAALDAIVAKALAKQPDDRFASAAEMAAALAAVGSAGDAPTPEGMSTLRAEGIRTVPAGPSKRAVAVVIALLSGSVFFLLFRVLWRMLGGGR